ncbi:hypothetical protein [Streptomyces sp. NPDC058373]|uniref:hypothetical protein n=1 Tax=Streptomyces sp. NPDC058373 TaxID=3346465 RepID=UPI003662A63F
MARLAAVPASMFPRYARTQTAPEATALLHKICRSYAYVGIAVPVLGIATGAALGALTDAWLLVSIVLTGIAAWLPVAVILPEQGWLLDTATSRASSTPHTATSQTPSTPHTATPDPPSTTDTADPATAADRRPATAKLAMTAGIFNLLWATVVVLMIVRPGSTTGA